MSSQDQDPAAAEVEDIERVLYPTDAKHDLTNTLAPFLDLHMLFPLISHLEENEMYPAEDLLDVKVQLLKPTNMIDYAIEISGEEDEDLLAARDQVFADLDELEELSAPLRTVVDNEELYAELDDAGNFTMPHLNAEFGVTADVLEAYYRFGKFQYECGDYGSAWDFMATYRFLNKDMERNLVALWGQLASGILLMQWEEASRVNEEIKNVVDQREDRAARSGGGVKFLEQLQLRSWLLHWNLFILLKNETEMSSIDLVNFFLNKKYLNAIQTNCPWLVRYLAACTIMAKGLPLPEVPIEQDENGKPVKKHLLPKNLIRKVIHIIKEEKSNYSDPITDFIEALFVRFDFAAAQDCLEECAKLCATDFFLSGFRNTFLEAARRLIFETHCRIHTTLSLQDVATSLKMTDEEAERWTVDLIRSANLEAKIDSDAGAIVLTKDAPEVYQRIVDQTKDLTYRSYQVFNKIRHVKNKGGKGNNNKAENDGSKQDYQKQR